ncbi:hypothetical protein ACN2WE_40895 [Streptomyces sp. cg28]
MRNVASWSFKVPYELFVDVPERSLVGAIVEGHRYISSLDDVDGQ